MMGSGSMSGSYKFFDGGMGTMLQQFGLKIGECPEVLNIENPSVVKKIHELYREAGSDFITTNTFGGNKMRLKKTNYSTMEVIVKALEIANSVVSMEHIAFDIGPTGEFIEPYGEATMEEIYEVYAEQISAGSDKAGLILIETMSDINEMEMAIKAARDCSKLPIYCTFTFMENGKTFMGTDVRTVTEFLNRQNIDVMGVNCSTGPDKMGTIMEEMLKYSKIPVMAQPNAGLPKVIDGKAVYDVTPQQYAEEMKKLAQIGVSILGGCCGTTPEFIREMVKELR
jgi:5-methyltetrahydrofolate--homocysteine methyltransferase